MYDIHMKVNESVVPRVRFMLELLGKYSKVRNNRSATKGLGFGEPVHKKKKIKLFFERIYWKFYDRTTHT